MVRGYAPTCCKSCCDTREPSEIPSSTSTDWVISEGIDSGRPAIAAIPTAIMAPEISPPGRLSHRNMPPPAAPIASVSRTWRVLVRLGRAKAGDADAGIRLTPFYVKSGSRAQLRQRDCSNARFRACWRIKVWRGQQQGPLLAAIRAGASLVDDNIRARGTGGLLRGRRGLVLCF